MKSIDEIKFLAAWSQADEAIRMMLKYQDTNEEEYLRWEKIYNKQMAITKAFMRKQSNKTQK